MGLVDSSKLGRFLTNLKTNFVETFMEKQPEMIYTAESSDGVNYTVTVPGVTNLYAGLRIMVKFGVNSASTAPKLNVNNLGAKNIRQALSTNNSATAPGGTNNWLTTACPVELTYTGSMWKTDFVRPSASNMYGTVPVNCGGTGATTAEAARTALGAVSQDDFDELVARVAALE